MEILKITIIAGKKNIMEETWWAMTRMAWKVDSTLSIIPHMGKQLQKINH